MRSRARGAIATTFPAPCCRVLWEGVKVAGEFRRQKLSAASQPPRDRSSKIVPASQWSSTARNGMQIRQNRFLMQQAHGAIALDPKPKAAEALGLLVNRVDLCGDGIRISIKLPVGSPERLPGQAPNHLSLIRMIPIQMRPRGVEMKLI